jgi:hypothetical protein
MGSQSRSLTILLLTVCLIIVGMDTAGAQGVYAKVSGEGTAAGLRYGGAVGYIARSKFQTGIFYQTEISKSEFSASIPGTFAGIETLIPFVKAEKIYFSAHLRSGLVNKKFVVFVPGFRTSIRVVNGIEAGLGMHWRYNRPAHELSIQFKI